jgi:hypothetical protein
MHHLDDWLGILALIAVAVILFSVAAIRDAGTGSSGARITPTRDACIDFGFCDDPTPRPDVPCTPGPSPTPAPSYRFSFCISGTPPAP